MTKDELIARLQVLGEQLNRDVSLTGTKEELVLRVAELEEELDDTDDGKQNTYFSSLDNMVAQGNVLPVLFGEMRVGSRVASQEISTADEGDGGEIVVIGR
ncbi:TPA: hypothetical protein JTE62_004468 [Escherichia coli]|nr:hypothetical protein [Escherichia coli]